MNLTVDVSMDLFWIVFSFSLQRSKQRICYNLVILLYGNWINLVNSVKKGLSCTLWAEVSVSWPWLWGRFKQSCKLCLNILSAKWFNKSLLLLRNFNSSLISTLKAWSGSGLLKSLQLGEFRILRPRLFHSIITQEKKFFKVYFCLEENDLTFFEHFS